MFQSNTNLMDNKMTYIEEILEQQKEIKEGIYFNMPEEDYHALPCLNRSSMEAFLIDDEEGYHHSYLNPDRPKNNPTAAMDLGTAIHCAILEPKKFGDIYIKKPEVEDYQDKIVFKGNDDFKGFLKTVGEKVSGTKAELIQRISPYLGDEHLIWEYVMNDFDSQIACGKRALSRRDFEIVEGIMDSMAQRPNSKQIFDQGVSEITIIYRDEATGELCKCRLDSGRAEAIGDLKSFSYQGKVSLREYVCLETIRSQYNFQYFVYVQALEAVIKRIRLGKAEVFGDVDPKWLENFLKSPRKQFYITLVRTTEPYQIISLQLNSGVKGATEPVYFSNAKFMFKYALERFCWVKSKVIKGESIINDNIIIVDDMHTPNAQYQGNFLGIC